MRTRIDRFAEDALIEFAEWFETNTWLGKERDCVNLYAHRFLARRVRKGAAIQDLAQIRIECGVAQPCGYKRPAATKDLVIWQDALSTAWNANWEPVNFPGVVMEWKTKRSGRRAEQFHDHDMAWLKAFTGENPTAFGYLVAVFCGDESRSVNWAKVARGEVQQRNRRA